MTGQPRSYAPDTDAIRRAHVRALAGALSPDEIEQRLQHRLASLRAVVAERLTPLGEHANDRSALERALVSVFYEVNSATESTTRSM